MLEATTNMPLLTLLLVGITMDCLVVVATFQAHILPLSTACAQ
jgi:hypothetical protein